MKTTYAFRNLAVNSVLNFQKEEFVYDFFNYFQSKSPIRSSAFFGEETYKNKLAIKVEKYTATLQSFENEIKQVIHTTHQTVINQYFEELREYKEWLGIIDESKLSFTFSSWNDDTYAEFLKKVDEESAKYFQSENRKMKHLEEYETPDSWSILNLLSHAQYGQPKMAKQRNYNFYTIEMIPDILDLQFFPTYVSFLTGVIEQFNSLVTKYIAQYDNGKIVSNSTVIVNHLDVLQAVNVFTPDAKKKLLPEPKRQKIKWNGTPKEFVELFAPLITDRNIYLNKESASDTEPIVKLLFDAFEIGKLKGEGDISIGSLSTYFKDYNAKPAS